MGRVVKCRRLRHGSTGTHALETVHEISWVLVQDSALDPLTGETGLVGDLLDWSLTSGPYAYSSGVLCLGAMAGKKLPLLSTCLGHAPHSALPAE